MKTVPKDLLQTIIGKKNFWFPKRTVNLSHYLAGIEGFDEQLENQNTINVPNIADFEIYSNGLAIIMMKNFKRFYVGIPNSKIKRITLENKQQIYEKKEKSIVGRAVIGGLIFGPVGALVGGMTGLKDGEKKSAMPDLILSIEIGDENNRDRVLLFSTKFKNKTKLSLFFKKHYSEKYHKAN